MEFASSTAMALFNRNFTETKSFSDKPAADQIRFSNFSSTASASESFVAFEKAAGWVKKNADKIIVKIIGNLFLMAKNNGIFLYYMLHSKIVICK